jgi:hypothetical protein
MLKNGCAILHSKIKQMQSAIPTFSNAHTGSLQQPSLFSRFINWCANQDHNRYGWLGVAIGSHGCVFTPLTMFAIIMSGNHIAFWLLAIIAMMMTLVTNLAALPTKITIPVFLFSILLDIAIIIACATMGFHISGTYQ